MRVVHDKPGNYHLDAGYSEKWKRDIFFGGIRLNKAYVSFYLMPMYMHPELLKKVSPELKRSACRGSPASISRRSSPPSSRS
jgi:hypothetical protein